MDLFLIGALACAGLIAVWFVIERHPESRLVRNERRKAFSSLAINAGVGCFLAVVLAPTVAAILDPRQALTYFYLAPGGFACLLAGFIVSRMALGQLEDD